MKKSALLKAGRNFGFYEQELCATPGLGSQAPLECVSCKNSINEERLLQLQLVQCLSAGPAAQPRRVTLALMNKIWSIWCTVCHGWAGLSDPSRLGLSMKSGYFSSNLSNACWQALHTIKAGRNLAFFEQDLVNFMYCVPRLGWALRPLQYASHARIPSTKSGCFSSNLSNVCLQALLHSIQE